jgi:hypothetical protein
MRWHAPSVRSPASSARRLDLPPTVPTLLEVTPRRFEDTRGVDDYRPRVPREAAIASAREELARLQAGGSAARPIDVESASQIEPRTLSTPCSRCDGPYRLDEHTAELLAERRVRVLRVHCAHCGASRVLYFRVVPAQES